MRIDAARRMLRESEAPIARIALACGYCDQSAFTRQFKAVTGLTPAQYRVVSLDNSVMQSHSLSRWT